MNVLTVDAGTSAIKAAVVADDGEILLVARNPVLARRNPGIDPMEYWNVVASTVRALPLRDQTVDAIAVTGQGDGLWSIDASGAPAGPAYEWNSVVAADAIRAWADAGVIEEHYRSSGTVLWPGSAAAIWCWLSDADPDHAQRVAATFCAKDWLNHQLCGSVTTDVTDGSIPFLDMRTGDYSEDAYARLGCDELRGKTAPIVPAGTEIGRVTAEAAAATGLTIGTPVLMGCIDVAALVHGAGLRDPGDAMAVLGTTAAAIVLAADLDTAGETVGATLRLNTAGRFLRVLGASSGTSTLDWYLQITGGDLDGFWADVGSGRPGVVMLPYLAGERVPFLAPDATGSFLGITPDTGRPELARAVALGVTFSLRHCLDAGEKAASAIVLTGGGSASPIWCQLVADVTGRDVRVNDRPHTACVGVASLVTATPVSEASDLVVHSPSADYQAEYDEFVSVGQQMRPIWSAMKRN